ncbi:16S rRNA (cytosine(967)-C(5))-methyltransferase RsmB [Halalkalibacter urbisdiaboli]|uniref:16S rRNA (cytosine(967)-C(5))-methyltransferase RsmB n=1 Tax=Halalkalibacter urbisdiaboli TaxID=1960589 RepID=UPI000B449A6F|nr:16S rRNA (cytosine(967)-C(5))-methyltransferase RsmB [Halalkalibacter urbisdiaboli]
MTKQVREVAVEVLLQIEKNQAYSNLLLNQTVNRTKLERRDIGLLTELVYGTIQRRDMLDFFLTPFVKKGLHTLEDWVRILLRLSVYQLAYLDRVPDRAVVHEAVNIAKKRGHKGISGMVNGVLRSIQREGLPTFETITDPIERLAIETSHPLWLVKRWVEQYGFEETTLICQSSLIPPSVTVRVNRIKATPEEVIEKLAHEDITARKGELSEDAIVIESGNVFETAVFKDGFVTVQDESSMLVGRALGALSGMSVLDACAAPGGKSTHIAEQMDNMGRLFSVDLHEHKVKLIVEQANRLGLSMIETKVSDSRKLDTIFEKETFDRILIDAPCSGFGVIRRKPDIKWAKREKDIDAIKRIQQEILTAVAPYLKKGGTLVYSTCTVDKDENEETVREFLTKHHDFVHDDTLQERLPEKVVASSRYQSGMVTILPHDFQSDGFFIAGFKKK